MDKNKNNKDIELDLFKSDFLDFADLIPSLITVYDEEHRVLYVNKAILDDLGLNDRNAIIGKSIFEFLLSEPSRVINRAKGTLSNGQSDYEEFELRSVQGSVVFIESRDILVKWNGQKALMSLAKNITKRKELYRLFCEIQELAESKNTALSQKMFDLNSLMGEMELYKKELEERIVANIQATVLPLLNKVRLKPDSQEHLDLLEKAINEILSEFGHKVALNLSPREREVVNFIKAGRTNKEIANLLNLSCRTIDRHRQAIREKLRLCKSGVSLRAWLHDNL